jgi:site-specific recombinase XerD
MPPSTINLTREKLQPLYALAYLEYLKEVAVKAGITKKVACHISRHRFGQQAGDKIDIRILQTLYRHSIISTIIGYQSNFIHKQTDDALDAVYPSKIRKQNSEWTNRLLILLPTLSSCGIATGTSLS